jgi:hypothetical protein
MKNKEKDKPSRTRPIHKIRHGAVSASIWKLHNSKGPMFNVTFQRAYKEGDDWKYSESFGKKDLLVLGFIAARAFEWIGIQPQRPSKEPPASTGTEDDVPF